MAFTNTVYSCTANPKASCCLHSATSHREGACKYSIVFYRSKLMHCNLSWGSWISVVILVRVQLLTRRLRTAYFICLMKKLISSMFWLYHPNCSIFLALYTKLVLLFFFSSLLYFSIGNLKPHFKPLVPLLKQQILKGVLFYYRIGNLIQSTITRLLCATCPSRPSRWISICRNMVKLYVTAFCRFSVMSLCQLCRFICNNLSWSEALVTTYKYVQCA